MSSRRSSVELGRLFDDGRADMGGLESRARVVVEDEQRGADAPSARCVPGVGGP